MMVRIKLGELEQRLKRGGAGWNPNTIKIKKVMKIIRNLVKEYKRTQRRS